MKRDGNEYCQQTRLIQSQQKRNRRWIWIAMKLVETSQSLYSFYLLPKLNPCWIWLKDPRRRDPRRNNQQQNPFLSSFSDQRGSNAGTSSIDDNSVESGPQFDIGGRKEPAPKEFPPTLGQTFTLFMDTRRPNIGPNLPRRAPKSESGFPRPFPRGGNTGFRSASSRQQGPSVDDPRHNHGFADFNFPSSTPSPLPLSSNGFPRPSETFFTSPGNFLGLWK